MRGRQTDKAKLRRGASQGGYALAIGLIAVTALLFIQDSGEEVERIFCVAADRLSGANGLDPDNGCYAFSQAALDGVPSILLVEDGGGYRWDDNGTPKYAATCDGYNTPPAEHEQGTADDAYWITLGGGSPTLHACDMTTDGGGWTLAMRLGTDDGLSYAAPEWETGSTLNASSPSASGLSSAVYPAYASLSGTSLRGCVGEDCMIQSISNETALGVFSGAPRPASFARSTIEAMVGSGDLDGLPGCAATPTANGINADAGGEALARMGGLADDTPACNSPDAAIGLGLMARDGTVCSAGSLIAGGVPQEELIAGYTLIDDNIITQDEGGLFLTYQRPYFATNWSSNQGFFVYSNSNENESGLRRMRISTMVEDQQILTAAMRPSPRNGFLKTLVQAPNGTLFISAESGNSHPVISVDPNTMTQTGEFGFYSTGLSNSTTRFVSTEWLIGLSAPGGAYAVTGSVFDDIGVLYSGTGGGLSYVWGSGQSIPRSDIKGMTSNGGSTVYIIGGDRTSSNATIDIYALSVSGSAYLTPGSGVSLSQIGTVSASDVAAGATVIEFGEVSGLIYDHSDGNLIFNVQLNVSGSSNQHYWVKWSPSSGVVWATNSISFVNYPYHWGHGYVDGDLGVMTSTNLYYINTSDGSISSVSVSPANENGAQLWDSRSKSLITYSTSHGWVRIYVDPVNNPPDGADTVSVNCETGALWVR